MGNIKGAVLIEIVKFLRSRKDQARAALPPELHGYLKERVLASSWYPEADYFQLMQAVAGLYSAPDGGDPWLAMGVAGASSTLDSAHRAMVRTGDTEATLKQFPLLWQLRHDTGKAEISFDGPGQARMTLRDYVLVSPEICRSVQGTINELVRRTGAEDVRIDKAQCRAHGADACEWVIRFRA